MPHQTEPLKIRRSGPNDAPLIEALFEDAFRRQPGPYRPLEIDALFLSGLCCSGALFSGGQGFVAETGGRLAGSAGWTLDGEAPARDTRPPERRRVPPGEATLRTVCVSPDFAGTGLAQRLVRRAILDAQSAGARSVGLYATAGSVGFYERLGFAVIDDVELSLAGGVSLGVAMMRLRSPMAMVAEQAS